MTLPSVPTLPPAATASAASPPAFDREFYRSLADQLPVSLGVLVVAGAAELRLMFVNSQAQREFALDGEALRGRPVQALFDGRLPPEVEQAMQRALRLGRTQEQEFAVAGVPPRTVNARFMPMSPPGMPALLLMLLRDVSAERHLQRELADSEVRFQEFSAAVDDGVFVTTIDRRRYDHISPRALQAWGLSLADLDRAPACFHERVLPDDLPAVIGRYAAEASCLPVDVSFRIRHPLLGLRWLRSRSRAQPSAGGEQLRVYGLITDVTEDREREAALLLAGEQAASASRAKSDFMANISHEIRTPMNGILGMSQLLLQGELGPQQRRHAEALYHSAESLLAIIDDLLDFSSIESGRLVLQNSDFDLAPLVDDAVQALAPAARDKRLLLRLHEEPGLPRRVHGDPRRLRQVIVQLLGNAIKFTDRGRVAVELRTVDIEGEDGPGRWVEIAVSDTGIGIPPDELPRLFDAFTQASGGAAKRFGGTGLGLAICRQLVDRMGGRLVVRSTPGEGSRFAALLPLPAAFEAGPPAAAAERHRLTPGGGCNILVVDDNPINQEVSAQMLKAAGCRVRVAGDAQQGLRALAEERFDLVLMDIQMPGMDGAEALRRFRAAAPGLATPRETPVVAVTASVLPGDAQRYAKLGFDDCLQKPFRLSQLHAMLQSRLSSVIAAAPAGDAAPAGGAARPGDWAAALSAELDAEALKRLTELDPTGANGLLKRVLTAFDGSLQRLLQELQQARAAGETAGLRHVSHTLKSSAASVGAMRLSQQCAEIERRVRQNEMDGLDALLDGMVEEGQRVLAFLKPVLAP